MKRWVAGLVPIRSNKERFIINQTKVQKMESEENIELVSLSHFRGRTFDNGVIVDEFQNLTKQQLGMVLGRLGKKSTMILTDDQQIDLKFQMIRVMKYQR